MSHEPFTINNRLINEVFDYFILRLRPCRRPLWQSRASWLLAWWLGNILIGLLVCCVFAVWCFVLPVLSVTMSAGSPSCWMLVFMSSVCHLLLPRKQPLTIAHCFKTGLLGSHCLAFVHIQLFYWSVCWLAGFWIIVPRAGFFRRRKW